MLTLTLVTPEKKLLTDVDIEEAIVPGERGELNILPGHAPLMTTLNTGVLRYKLKGESDFKRASISWGYCEVNPKGINVLADTAETPEEIDKDRAKKALETSEKRLQDAGLTVDEYVKHQRKISRARTRLDV